MKIQKTKFTVLGLALVSGLTMATMTPVIAEQSSTGDPVIMASGKTAESEALATRMSEAGFMAMRAITAARIAIFNDKPELAKQLVASAIGYLDVVANDDAEYTLLGSGDASGSTGERMVPIDGSLFVADTFVSTPEKQQQLADANELLKQGESAKAIEILKLASVDVSIQRVLMPVGPTIQAVNTASDLLEKDQFYEANLALKSAVDRLRADTIDLFQPE